MTRSTAPPPLHLSGPGVLSPAQRLDAVRRLQARAEQRVKLGTQLFKAAEARLTQYDELVGEARREQERLREQLESELAVRLAAHDRRADLVDDRLTGALDRLDQRLSTMQQQWQQTEARLERMLRQSERLLNQSQSLLHKANVPRASVRT